MTCLAPALRLLDRDDLARAQELVTASHYLRKPIDTRCSVEGYGVRLGPGLGGGQVGVLLLGRPQATRCFPWYGSVDDVAAGRAAVTRWQVLNLARVYFDPEVQPGGLLYGPDCLPGFFDRHSTWRSCLGSTAITMLRDRVVVDYLLRRPPCFLEEPYELRWLLSYCNTRLHRGVLYRVSEFDLYRTNESGIQTWRAPLRKLTAEEDARVREAALQSPRSIHHRALRARQAQGECVA